jgi:hypothetical protein
MHRLIIAGLNGQQIAAKDIALLHTQIFFNPEGGCFLKPRVGKLCDQPWDSADTQGCSKTREPWAGGKNTVGVQESETWVRTRASLWVDMFGPSG